MSAVTAAGILARLAVRRDRFRLLAWTAVTVGLAAASASSVKGLYPSAASRQQYAATSGKNPASAVLSGPQYGTGTLGGIVLAETATTVTLIVAIVTAMLVVRHTRREEQTGRGELVAAAVVGQQARLAAALIVAVALDLVIAAGVTVSFVGLGLPVVGSLAFGAGLALTGAVFAGIAGVTAQLSAHARTSNATTFTVLGAAFVLRAVGDSSSVAGRTGPVTRLSWLSPLGWAQQLRPYAGERWWVLAVPLLVTVGLIALAVALAARRDVDAGLLPARLGRPTASAILSGPIGLAWRLQRGALIGWVVGAAAAGAVFGSIAADVDTMVGSNASAANVFTELGGSATLVDSYLAWVLGVMGVAAAAFGVSAALRMRAEETAMRAEQVLATATNRWRWAGAYTLWALTGTALTTLAAGASVGLAHGARTGDVGGALADTMTGAVVQLPAAALITAVAVAVFGVRPALSSLAWASVGVAAVIGQLGTVLGLDHWVLDISPFTHIPRVPGHEVTAAPLIWLTSIATVLITVGLARFRHRDIGILRSP
jgi:ABC-2 type transport system permease protein